MREAAELHKRVGIDSKEVLPEEKEFLIRKAKELGTLVLTELNKVIQNRTLPLNMESLCQKVSFIISYQIGWFRARIKDCIES